MSFSNNDDPRIKSLKEDIEQLQREYESLTEQSRNSLTDVERIRLTGQAEKIYKHLKSKEEELDKFISSLDSERERETTQRDLFPSSEDLNSTQILHLSDLHFETNDEFRYDINVDGRKLHRICAGTFGAPTKELNTGIPWQYNLIKIKTDEVTVCTRKRESENGGWDGDFRWRYGKNDNKDYYTIELTPKKQTDNSVEQGKKLSQHRENVPNATKQKKEKEQLNNFKSKYEQKKYYIRYFFIFILFFSPLILILIFIEKYNTSIQKVIADFTGAPGQGALTKIGLPFSIMSDNVHNMKSKIWYQRLYKGNRSDDAFLRIYYDIIPHDSRQGFVGIFSDFTLPPAKPINLSEFSGISFDMRIEDVHIKNTEIRLVLYSNNIKNNQFAYPMYSIKPKVTSKEGWSKYKILFSEFKSPDFASDPDSIKLDVNRVFRFGFVFLSTEKVNGQIDFDNISWLE